MKRNIAIVALMVKREIFPASDSQSRGVKRVFRLMLFNAPMIGLGLLLLLITICGLLFLEFQQRVTRELREFESNPTNGIFAKRNIGYFYLDADRDIKDTPRNLDYWTALPVEEVFGDTASIALRGQKVFSSVKPFSEIHLTFQRKDGEHVSFLDVIGLLTPTDPMRSSSGNSEKAVDTTLLQKVSNQLLKGSFDGIIASKAGMKNLGYRDETNYPKTINVTRSEHGGQKKDIPIPLMVVEKLPYVYYMLSMKQLRRIEQDDYYDREKSFRIFFNETPTSEQETSIKAALQASEINDQGQGENKVMYKITLPEPKSGVEIAEGLADQTPLFVEIKGEKMDLTRNATNKYRGAIFHLNFALPHRFLWQPGQIEKIQEFFERNDVDVSSEFIELYAEMLKSQNILKEIRRFFWLAVALVGLILPLIFWIVIQTRMFRIGVKRMIGYPDSMIMAAYGVVGLLLAICAFAVPTLIFTASNLLPWTEVVLLGMGMLLLTEAGILMPVGYYLYALQPAEMLSFQF